MNPIDKDIPIPARVAANKKYEFDKLGIGESFRIEFPDGGKEVLRAEFNRIRSAATQYGYRSGRMFTFRTEKDGWRVWRVANGQDREGNTK